MQRAFRAWINIHPAGIKQTKRSDLNTKAHKTELLAPAGNRDGFLAALQAGADAVYLGGEKFGARAYAENFRQEELIRTIRDAHILGKRVYLTVNILMRERELPELLEYMRPVCDAGLDGVIVQDLGAIHLLSENFPDLELHASTQLSVTAPESVRFLKRLGVCRVVPARELSLREIKDIKAESVEVETFVHGAMCYSYSGRCLMSSFLGGRSGNRGRCAGPCRLPYTVLDGERKPVEKDAASAGECYPLSMRDMCALELLPELIDAGIDSFKIEGRMKKPEYAAGVTAIYRKYLDRYEEWNRGGCRSAWKIDPEDMKLLKALYLRTDLCSGYYHERNGRDMVTIRKPGYSGTDEALLEDIRRRFPLQFPKLPVTGRVYLHCSEPSRLVVSGRSNGARQTAAVEGDCVETAQKHPMDKEEIMKRIRKTGESPFVFESLSADISESVFMPVGQLNALRRKALDELEEKLLRAYDEQNHAAALRKKHQSVDSTDTNHSGVSFDHDNLYGKTLHGVTPHDEVTHDENFQMTGLPEAVSALPLPDRQEPSLIALVSDLQQLQAAVSAGVSRIILEYDTEISQNQIEKFSETACIYRALPYIFRTEDRTGILKQIGMQRNGMPLFRGFFVRTLEELELVRAFREKADRAPEILADASIYEWNRASGTLIRSFADRFVAPLELTGKEIDRMIGAEPESRKSFIIPVYGKVPLMISANCLRKTEGYCFRNVKQNLSGKGHNNIEHYATIKDRQPGGVSIGRCGQRPGKPGNGRFWYLKDRMKKEFPVRIVCSGCHNIIYNAEPLSLHRYLQDPVIRGAGALLLAFTDETGPETGAILQYFGKLIKQEMIGPSGQHTEKKNRRRSSSERSSEDEERPFDSFTNGHYRRGAI